MMVLPRCLFWIRKAKVGRFMCSCPFWTGPIKALAGTTMSVVVLMMDISTVELDWGSLREGCVLGVMSSSAMFIVYASLMTNQGYERCIVKTEGEEGEESKHLKYLMK